MRPDTQAILCLGRRAPGRNRLLTVANGQGACLPIGAPMAAECRIFALQHNFNAALATDLTPSPTTADTVDLDSRGPVRSCASSGTLYKSQRKCILGHDTATQFAAVQLLGPKWLTAHNQSGRTSITACVTVMAAKGAVDCCIVHKLSWVL